jgi:hypothetical protein
MIPQNDNEWSRKFLDRYYLKQAVYVGNDEVFACGSMLPEDYIDGPDIRRYGVVLYSADNGSNWTVIYQNKRVKTVNALTAKNVDSLWIVGDNNLIMELTKP